jgi:hypothetical protein
LKWSGIIKDREGRMEKKRFVENILIVLIFIGIIVFAYNYSRNCLPGIRTSPGDIGLVFTQQDNFITIVEVKDMDTAINHLKQLEDLENIYIKVGKCNDPH